MSRRVVCIIVGVCVVAVVLFGVLVLSPLGQSVTWVGQTDVEIRLVVTDAASGRALAGATVVLEFERGWPWCEEEESDEVTLTTDEHGRASHLLRGCMCSGASGVFVEKFAVSLPACRVHAAADGYRPSEPIHLRESDYGQRATRGRGVAGVARVARVTVPVELVRDPRGGESGLPEPEGVERLRGLLESPSRDERVAAFRELIALVRPGMLKADVDEWIGPGEHVLASWREWEPTRSLYGYMLDLGQEDGQQLWLEYYIVYSAPDGIKRVEEVGGPVGSSFPR